MKLSCEEIQEGISEMALGIASSADRRQITRHVRECDSCRERLQEMSRVSDSLLLASPSIDPPRGFEHRVLENMKSAKPERAIGLRWVAFAATVALIIGSLWAWLLPRMFVSEQEALAAQYVQALETLGGKALYAGRMESPEGKDAGAIFVYEGSPSWMFVTIEDGIARGHFSVSLGLEDGETRRFGGLDLEEGKGSLGVRLDFPIKQIRSIEIVDSANTVVYVMRV